MAHNKHAGSAGAKEMHQQRASQRWVPRVNSAPDGVFGGSYILALRQRSISPHDTRVILFDELNLNVLEVCSRICRTMQSHTRLLLAKQAELQRDQGSNHRKDSVDRLYSSSALIGRKKCPST
jgi:hypothetical protein